MPPPASASNCGQQSIPRITELAADLDAKEYRIFCIAWRQTGARPLGKLHAPGDSAFLACFSGSERGRYSNFYLSVNGAPQISMKHRMDKTLQFWVDVAYEHLKRDHPNLTKRQLVAQILGEYERRGDALRCLDKDGKITRQASPRFLDMLADAERDARDDLIDWP